MTELLERLAAGIAYIRSGNTPAAMSNLRYCTTLDPSQCDVWIAIAAANGAVDNGTLERIVDTKNTFDHCLTQLEPAYTQVIIDRNPHLALDFAELKAPIININGIDLAYAASLALDKRFALAEASLASLTSDEAAAVRSWVYHLAGRFQDVLEAATPLLASSNPDWVIYGHLFTGIAHAHFGNFGAARDHLFALLPTESGPLAAEPAAEAAYWIALTWREEDDSQAAAQYFQRALSLSPQSRFQHALADDTLRIRLTKPDLIARRSDPWDVATEPTLAQAQAQEMATKRGGLLQEGLAELDSMIGMEHLKKDIRQHCNYIRGLQRREQLGLPATKSSKHLIFAGPPGTGKTTVAEIVAKIYSGLGVIKTDNLVTVGRGDFIGEYSGWTTPKVKAKLQEALDGVLFIDEAYALVLDTGEGGSKDSFGAEAATEIVAFMETNRDRIVVIIAGYGDQIDRLLDTNEGWGSRFKKRFDFQSYGIDELIAIAELWCAREQYILPTESVDFIRSQTPGLNSIHPPSGRKVIDKLGNGRFVRNLMEVAAEYALGTAMEHSLADDADSAAVQTLTADSVQYAFHLLVTRELGGTL